MTLSRLAEFRAAEKALQEQLAQLEALKNDAGLKKEIEFEQKLQGLMKSYNKNVRDIIAILDPGPATSKTSSAPSSARRVCSRCIKIRIPANSLKPKAAITAGLRPGKSNTVPPL